MYGGPLTSEVNILYGSITVDELGFLLLGKMTQLGESLDFNNYTNS